MSDMSREGLCQGMHYDILGIKSACKRIATHDKFCIFHASSKNNSDFMVALLNEIDQWENDRKRVWDFSGFVFNGRLSADDLTSNKDETSSPIFSSGLIFTGAQFDDTVWFLGATFLSPVWFYNSLFQNDAYFGYTQFKQMGNFGRACFDQKAWFAGAHFERAGFANTRFCDIADFESSYFEQTSSFKGAKFKNGLSLQDATFRGHSNFNKVSLRGQINLAHCSFTRSGDFSESTIIGHVRVLWPGIGDKWSQSGDNQSLSQIPRGTLRFCALRGKELLNWGTKPTKRELPVLDLRDNHLADDCDLLIENCNMGHILLCGTGATQIRFKEVEWPKLKDRLFHWLKFDRQVTGDEYMNHCVARHPGKEQAEKTTEVQLYRRIRTTYQQLSKRFSADLDYPLAVEFDRGSFEMRLRESVHEKGIYAFGSRIWLLLYKHVSHYSGSMILPVLWWLAVLFIFAGFYGALDPNIYWFSCPDDFYIDIGKHWDYIKLSLRSALTLTASTISGDPGLQLTDDIHTLQAIQRTLSITLAALFIFSLRRRVKH